MSRNPLSAENRAAHKHAKVARAGEQGYQSKLKVPPGGVSVFCAIRTIRRFYSKNQEAGSKRKSHQQSTKFEDTGTSISTPCGPPCRGH